MSDTTLLIILTSCTAAHITMTAVIALFARYRVQYLSLAWIMGIFGGLMIITLPFYAHLNGAPCMLHPLMLLSLSAICFLQSIYPLSIPMPAYLQWGRMWKYALPIILLYSAYILMIVFGYKPLYLTSLKDLTHHILNVDIWLRFIALILSLYYVSNILLLPKRMAHSAELPRYIKGYCTVLSLSVVLYVFTAIFYDTILLIAYVILFTLINLYLCFRTLETKALELPKPKIVKAKKNPNSEGLTKEERDDFNKANKEVFDQVDFWMQSHPSEWTVSSFNRDKLCEATGVNRHLLLQCLRSQGFNDSHDYINSYRLEELKRRIRRGLITNLADVDFVGFGTIKTARSVFEKLMGQSLDSYMAEYKEDDETE